MAASAHRQFCPLAMASDLLCSRWTMMLLSELLSGTTRFNDLRRGLPRMSPALLSKRLRDLEQAGIVLRHRTTDGTEVYEYSLTEAGRAIEPIVDAMGDWGHRWITTQATLAHLDVKLLMWNMRRKINPNPLPQKRSTIQFIFRDLPSSTRNWWLLVQPGQDVDLCSAQPSYHVDLYVTTDLRTLTEVWMGYAPIGAAMEDGRLVVVGNRELESSFQTWLGASRFASLEKCVA